MPEFAGITRDGKLVRKSQLSTGTPSLAKSQMIAPRPRKATPTARVHQQDEARAPDRVAARAARDHGVLRPRGGGDLRAGHSYTCRYLRTSRIEMMLSSQREHEQREADGEDRQVLDRAGGDVAARLRRDVGRHGLEALARVEPEVGRLAAGDQHEHGLADRRARRRGRARRRCPTARPGRRSAARPGAWTRRARTRPRAASRARPTSRPRPPRRSSAARAGP